MADGVFIRAGTHPDVLHGAVASIRKGAEEAGRDRESVRLGLVVHTVLRVDAERALLAARGWRGQRLARCAAAACVGGAHTSAI